MSTQLQDEVPGPMTKDRPFVKITPDEWLKFTKEKVNQEITFQNLTSMKVAFKIRLTSVNDYLVKPNCGFIEPNATSTAQITLLDNYETQRPHRILIQVADPKGESDRFKVWEKYLPNAKDVQMHKLFVTLPTEIVTKVVQNYIKVETTKKNSKEEQRMKDELNRVNDEHEKLKESLAKLKAEKDKAKARERKALETKQPPTDPQAKQQQQMIFFVLVLCIVLLVGYQMGDEDRRPGPYYY